MIAGYLAVIGVLMCLVLLARARPGFNHRHAVQLGWRQLRPLLIRLPVALVAASFLAELIPPRWFTLALGEGSGVPGIFAASLLGGFLPGGPMVSFPLALVVYHAGAGIPHMVALLTAWSVLATHRVIAFELPIMGWEFVWRRVLASIALPPLAGLLALAWTTL